MKTLVSLSGGVNSTYLLWKLLSDTQDEVTTVFVDTSAIDEKTRKKYDVRTFNFGGNDQELANVQTIVSWLKENVRDFNFLVEPMSLDYLVRGVGFPNNPPAYITRYAIPKINDGSLDRICFSHEWDNDGFGNGGTVTHRRTGAWVAYELFVANAQRGQIDFTLLDMGYNKSCALTELPQPLLDVVWGDKQDEGRVAQMAYFQSLLDEGKTPREITDIAMARCTLPNGQWHSMRLWLAGQEPNEKTTWDMPTWPSSYIVSSSGNPDII